MIFLFFMLSAIMVISALFVVFSKSPINNVIFLIICFIAMAGHYILLNAQFLAVVHIIAVSYTHLFEPIDIGDLIKLNMNRCILCYRCVKVADQLTDKRVHGVLNRGDHSEISTYILNAVDNDFSGNMIDVCPVGALTDRTFRFKSRVWFTKPMDAPVSYTHLDVYKRQVIKLIIG